jgi:guanylate kinase
MPKVEFKAHCMSRDRAESDLRRAGGSLLLPGTDTEKLFRVHTGHVRYYEREAYEADLIGRFKISAADIGESEPGADISDGVSVAREAVFAGDGWVVSIDRIDDYDFLNVEVAYQAAEGAGSALATAKWLRTLLGIGYLDIVPWSYQQLGNIISSAKQWRRRLGNLDGRLFLIDGPSGAGKSTLARVLREEAAPGYVYVPRCSSRARRPDDVASGEYLHISIDEFRHLAEAGSFLEYREFMFQMGYGLRWSNVADALESERVRAAYALVNLGNSRHIQRFVPDATTVLVTAPLDQLEGRMKARAAHPPEAIAERLENARRGAEAAAISDHVIENANGRMDDSIRAIRKIVYG